MSALEWPGRTCALGRWWVHPPADPYIGDSRMEDRADRMVELSWFREEDADPVISNLEQEGN